jgi:hypothetical protein
VQPQRILVYFRSDESQIRVSLCSGASLTVTKFNKYLSVIIVVKKGEQLNTEAKKTNELPLNPYGSKEQTTI